MEDAFERQKITFFYERWKATATGVVDTLPSTFALLILIRFYQAGTTVQSLVATGGMLGLIGSPLALWISRRIKWRANNAAAILYVFAAFFFGMACLIPYQGVYVMGCVMGLSSLYAVTPLMTQIYRQNYSSQLRGRLFSWNLMISVSMRIIFAFGMGWVLDLDMGKAPYLMMIYAMAALFGAYCMFRIPSDRLTSNPERFPYQSLKLLLEDSKFRLIMGLWMLKGLAGGMIAPLVVLYLVKPEYGLEYSPDRVALLGSVIPGCVLLFTSRTWGRLFDRFGFFWVRLGTDVCSLMGILCFFCLSSFTGFWMFVVAAILFGTVASGGGVIWSLWVTHFAPKEKVAEYMSIHSFLSGCSMFFSSLLGVQMTRFYRASEIALVSFVLLLLSAVLFATIPMKRMDE